MRPNLQDAIAQGFIFRSGKVGGTHIALEGDFVIPEDGPHLWFMTAEVVNPFVTLPEPEFGRVMLIVNAGPSNNIHLRDEALALLKVIVPGEGVFCFSSLSEWWVAAMSGAATINSVSAQQMWLALASTDDLTAIQAALPVSQNDPVTIQWNTNAPIVQGDDLSDLIQTTLGLSAGQLTSLFDLARAQ